MMMEEYETGNGEVKQLLRDISGEESFRPSSARDIAGLLFHTCYMGSVS